MEGYVLTTFDDDDNAYFFSTYAMQFIDPETYLSACEFYNTEEQCLALKQKLLDTMKAGKVEITVFGRPAKEEDFIIQKIKLNFAQ